MYCKAHHFTFAKFCIHCVREHKTTTVLATRKQKPQHTGKQLATYGQLLVLQRKVNHLRGHHCIMGKA